MDIKHLLKNLLQSILTIFLVACGASRDSGEEIVPDTIGPYAFMLTVGNAWPNYDLYWVSADSETYTLIANSADQETFYGQGPDKRLYYLRDVGDSSQFDIYSVASDGSDRRVIANSPNPERMLGWSPSGRVIYTEEVLPEPSLASNGSLDGVVIIAPLIYENYDLYSVLPDGTDRKALANSINEEQLLEIIDTDQVIYSERFDGQNDLHIVNVDGTNPTVLANTVDIEQFESYIPTEKIIYTRYIPDSAAAGNIYSVDADGSNTRQLTTSTNGKGVVHVTDFGWIIYHEEIDGEVQLRSVHSEGGANVTLSSRVGGSTFLSFLEGRVIYQHANLGQADIYSIRPDGTDDIVLANTSDSERWYANTNSNRIIYQRWRPVAPDLLVLQSDIYSILPDGSDLKALAVTRNIEAPIDYTDEGYILYQEMADVNSYSKLMSVKDDGVTPPIPLFPTVGAGQYCGIANDGRIIVVHSSTPSLYNSFEVFALNQDGTQKITLSETPGEYRCGPMAPNNRVIYTDFTQVISGTANDQHYSISTDGTNRIRIKQYSNEDYIGPYIRQ